MFLDTEWGLPLIALNLMSLTWNHLGYRYRNFCPRWLPLFKIGAGRWSCRSKKVLRDPTFHPDDKINTFLPKPHIWLKLCQPGKIVKMVDLKNYCQCIFIYVNMYLKFASLYAFKVLIHYFDLSLIIDNNLIAPRSATGIFVSIFPKLWIFK